MMGSGWGMGGLGLGALLLLVGVVLLVVWLARTGAGPTGGENPSGP